MPLSLSGLVSSILGPFSSPCISSFCWVYKLKTMSVVAMAMVQPLMMGAPCARAELPSLSRLSPAPLLRSLGIGRQWDSVSPSYPLAKSFYHVQVRSFMDSHLTANLQDCKNISDCHPETARLSFPAFPEGTKRNQLVGFFMLMCPNS